jgi:hypothetical protein
MCVSVSVFNFKNFVFLKKNSSHILVTSYSAGLLTSLTPLVSYNLHNSFFFQLINHEDKFGNYFMPLLHRE